MGRMDPLEDACMQACTSKHQPKKPRSHSSAQWQAHCSPGACTLTLNALMLVLLATYVQDAEVEISNLRSEFVTKDKEIDNANSQIKSLNDLMAALQEKHITLQDEVKSMEEAKFSSDSKVENLKKQVSELMP
ncbi:hypothetical protein AHAS_Ahas09G0097100 [Arachis hypogaea]